MGTVVGLQIKVDKNTRPTKVTNIIVNLKDGIVGDVNSLGDRQISFLTLEAKNSLVQQDIQGLCIHRFYENITISGIDTEKINIGQKLILGNSICEVTSKGKNCFEECDISIKNLCCPLLEGVFFAKVIQGGSININGKVNIPFAD